MWLPSTIYILYFCSPHKFCLTKLNTFPLPYRTTFQNLRWYLCLSKSQVRNDVFSFICFCRKSCEVEDCRGEYSWDLNRNNETWMDFSPSDLRLDVGKFFVLSLIISWPGAHSLDQFNATDAGGLGLSIGYIIIIIIIISFMQGIYTYTCSWDKPCP